MMLALTESQEKELKRKAKAEINDDGEDDTPSSDNSDEDDYDEQIQEDDDEDESDEAVNGDKPIRDSDLGFAREERKENSIESEEDEVFGSEDESTAESMVSNLVYL